MRIRCIIKIFLLSTILSSCGNINDYTNDEMNLVQNSNVSVEKEVSCIANIYKCVKDEQTGKEKYGLLLNESLVYQGGVFSIGASMYIKNEMIDDKDISILCVLLLDGVPIQYSIDGSKSAVMQYIMLQNGVEKRIKIDFIPDGLSEKSKNIVLLGIPFAEKEKITLYENDILYCAQKIVSLYDNNLECDEIIQPTYNYIESIDEVIRDEIKEQGLIYEQEKYIHNFIYSNEVGEYFTSDIKEGKNETLLFCDGKLFPGFDKKEYFLWQGKDKYINMEVNTETLSKGEHVMFVVTVECIDDYITAGKSLNRKVYINEEK